jgi:hypothetical protein
MNSTINDLPPYEWELLEENLINYFIEKVIVMREVPLMKAAQYLERSKNINKIQERLQKVTPSHSFASKQTTKKMLQAQANRD